MFRILFVLAALLALAGCAQMVDRTGGIEISIPPRVQQPDPFVPPIQNLEAPGQPRKFLFGVAGIQFLVEAVEPGGSARGGQFAIASLVEGGDLFDSEQGDDGGFTRNGRAELFPDKLVISRPGNYPVTYRVTPAAQLPVLPDASLCRNPTKDQEWLHRLAAEAADHPREFRLRMFAGGSGQLTGDQAFLVAFILNGCVEKARQVAAMPPKPAAPKQPG